MNIKAGYHPKIIIDKWQEKKISTEAGELNRWPIAQEPAGGQPNTWETISTDGSGIEEVEWQVDQHESAFGFVSTKQLSLEFN